MYKKILEICKNKNINQESFMVFYHLIKILGEDATNQIIKDCFKFSAGRESFIMSFHKCFRQGDIYQVFKKGNEFEGMVNGSLDMVMYNFMHTDNAPAMVLSDIYDIYLLQELNPDKN